RPATPTTALPPLSLHDALPISESDGRIEGRRSRFVRATTAVAQRVGGGRSRVDADVVGGRGFALAKLPAGATGGYGLQCAESARNARFRQKQRRSASGELLRAVAAKRPRPARRQIGRSVRRTSVWKRCQSPDFPD